MGFSSRPGASFELKNLPQSCVSRAKSWSENDYPTFEKFIFEQGDTQKCVISINFSWAAVFEEMVKVG